MSEANPKSTDQFDQQTIAGKKAYVAYCAIWPNGGMHTLIGAPTMERLQVAWRQITGVRLNTERAYRVLVANGGSK